MRKDAMFRWIQDCEANGRALCQRGGADSIIERLTDSDAPAILQTLASMLLTKLFGSCCQSGV